LHARLPIVTTRMGGALEIVDERCGVLTPPEPGAVAAELERLGHDHEARRRLGANGPARAIALCDPPQQAEQLRRAILSVLNE
ncbi:MAG: glycosyltransferase, partial [Planctomycetota bacterium]